MVGKIIPLAIALVLLGGPCALMAHGGQEKPAVVVGPSWPRWRGAEGDGVSKETSWNPKSLQGNAKILWKAAVGTGYSSPVIQNGRLFMMGLHGASLDVLCLDAATGRVVWKKGMKSIWEPQATPTIDGDRLYCLNQDGTLFCMKAANGSIAWKEDLPGDLGAVKPSRGWSASPVVDGALLLLNANTRMLALDKMTGELRWKIEDKVPMGSWGSYATPVVADIGGVRCALFLGPSTLIAADVSTGTTLWSYPHGDMNHAVADPVVSGDGVFISLPDTCSLVKVTAAGPRMAWRTTDFTTWLPPPVLVNGYMYGSYIDPKYFLTSWDAVRAKGLPLRCVEWSTGKVMWEKSGSYVSIMAAAGTLVMIELDGTLHAADAAPGSYRETASTSVLVDKKKPAVFAVPPVLCNGRLYIRSYDGDLICLDARG